MKKWSLTRRDFLKAGSIASLACSIPKLPVKAAAEKKPNIILVMADDLGYECIGANGSTSYKTPVLDSMAVEGMRFEHCYAQPLCTPTRVKLMTGIYNVKNYVEFGILDRKQTTFGHIFKKAGYKTCVVGKWQLGKQPDSAQHFGFDESCLWHHTRRVSRYPNPGLEINGVSRDYKNGQYGPDVVSDYACDFIERNQNTPFLVYYPMILTHCPFEPTPDSPDWNPSSKGSKTYKGDSKYFGDMVTYMDKIIGKIISKLDALGLRDNTLVIFTGDNGTDSPVVSMMSGGRKIIAGKGKTTDAGTRVPMIAQWTGVIPAGRVCSDLVDFSDFLPTICDAANVSVPAKTQYDGRSFFPQLQGKKGSPRDWIYCWYSRSGASNNAKEFVRNKRYKLYRSGRFYDIANDVLEENDLSTQDLDKKAEKVRKKLQEVLDNYTDARPKHLYKKSDNK